MGEQALGLSSRLWLWGWWWFFQLLDSVSNTLPFAKSSDADLALEQLEVQLQKNISSNILVCKAECQYYEFALLIGYRYQ